MKKLLILPAILLTLGLSAQKVLVVNPNCNLTVFPTDTAWLQTLVTTSDGFASINMAFASGPNIPVMGAMITDWTSGLQAKVRIPVTKLTVGTYAFTGVARSLSGGVMPFVDTVFVVNAPPLPVPRKLLSVTFTLVGTLWITQYKYDDGTTQ